MIPTVVTVLALAVVVAALIFIPRMLLKRAIRTVIARFRKAGATSPETAKTLLDLRLESRGVFGNFGRVRDYKPMAVRLLGQAEIILGTEEGGTYLSEENLENSSVKKFARMK